MAFESEDGAIQGMPRRDKQLGSKRSQSCLQPVAGESGVSALATTNSSRASGNNASTPTRLAKATREADATKRKFEYKAYLLRAEFRPPIRRKDNAAVAGLCPREGSGPVELETVLNGQQPPAGRRLPLPARESGGERAGSREAWEQNALVEPADAQQHDAEPNE